MKPAVNVITLGVKDLARSKRFYAEGLGWPIRVEDDNWVVFTLGSGDSVLALYPWDELAADADVPAEGTGFRGITLAYVVRKGERVDEVLAEAVGAGAKIMRPARKADWGGYSGYFADPDGYLWEVAKAEELPSAEDQAG
jgi:catechol 2,3-dioxygenase-like lactoylglutathione lyase family enzyme